LPRPSCYLACALVGLAGLARAQGLETEHRLKSAGVDPELRRAVHRAIADGVKYLRSVQRADGSFHPGAGAPAQESHAGGWTALCGLALRHSGLPDGVDAARRSLNYLLPDGTRPRPELLRTVYSSSVTTLLAATESRNEAIALLGAALAGGQTPTGWWGYSTAPRGLGDLSNSQFAVLALSTSRRAGAPVGDAVWKRHVDSLVAMQMPDGSWSYGGTIPWSYPTGTFMGLANLVQAAEQIGARTVIEDARRRALRAMIRDVRATLDAFDQGWLRDYYALYAMERACVFVGLEQVGGRSWYVDGARTLTRIQEEDGSWSGRDYRYWGTTPPGKAPERKALRPSMEATAFALLFLARAPEHDRVTTPRPIDAPTITGRDAADPPPEAPQADAEETPPIPIGLAEQLLAVLKELLKNRKADPESVKSSLLAVIDAARRVGGPGAEVEDWRARLASLLLEAFLYRGRPASSASGVHRIAARALGNADPSISPRFIDAIERYVKEPPAGEPDMDVLREAFLGLARLNRIESLRWLRDRMVKWKGTDESAAVAIAALDAMTEFLDVPGRERNKTFSLLLRSCPRAGTTPLPPVAAELAAAHIRAFQWLATDPQTLLPPRRGMPTCSWIVSLDDFEKWFRTTDAKKAPWKD